MIYAKPLPRIDNIVRLAKITGPYPVKARSLLETARLRDFHKSTLDFLRLFPSDEAFESRADFLTRCDELELMIREERKMPSEALRSPQD